MARLVLSRDYSIVLQTKADDVRWPGKRVRHATDIDDVRENRFVLAPYYDDQRPEVMAAFERAWQQKGWLVAIDELFYVQDYLGIRREVDRLLTQGRSKGLTVMMGMQRPVGVTRFGLSQASHVIAFHQDGRDAKTIAESAGLPREVEKRLGVLREHEFLWYSVAERGLFVGRVQDLEAKEAA